MKHGNRRVGRLAALFLLLVLSGFIVGARSGLAQEAGTSSEEGAAESASAADGTEGDLQVLPGSTPITTCPIQIVHKQFPRPDKALPPIYAIREPIYRTGERVQIVLYRPGGDDASLETVTVRVRSQYSNTQGFELVLNETNVSSNTFAGYVEVNDSLIPQGPTADRGYSMLSTGPTESTSVITRILGEQHVNLPSENLGQLVIGSPEGIKPPVQQFMEAGGVEVCTITYESHSVRFLAARSANLLYVTGAYTPGGGLNDAGLVVPPRISGVPWRSNLQLLIFATGYAVDINDYWNLAPLSGMKGVHGADWWGRFGGTLLGYSSCGPSPDVNAHVVEKLLERATRPPETGDNVERSAHLCKAWMQINVTRLVTGPSAVDAGGSYYHIPPKRSLRLRGVPFTVPVIEPWVKAPRSVWEQRNLDLRAENAVRRCIEQLLRQVKEQQAGGPPPKDEFLSEPFVNWVVEAAGLPSKNPKLKERIREVMTARYRYEEHIYYDGYGHPRPRI